MTEKTTDKADILANSVNALRGVAARIWPLWAARILPLWAAGRQHRYFWLMLALVILLLGLLVRSFMASPPPQQAQSPRLPAAPDIELTIRDSEIDAITNIEEIAEVPAPAPPAPVIVPAPPVPAVPVAPRIIAPAPAENIVAPDLLPPPYLAAMRLLLQAEAGQNYAAALAQLWGPETQEAQAAQNLLDAASHAVLAPYATQGLPSLAQVTQLYQQFRGHYAPTTPTPIANNNAEALAHAPPLVRWLARWGGEHIRITRLPPEIVPQDIPNYQQLDALIVAGELTAALQLAEVLLADDGQNYEALAAWHNALKIYLMARPVLVDLRVKILQATQP